MVSCWAGPWGVGRGARLGEARRAGPQTRRPARQVAKQAGSACLRVKSHHPPRRIVLGLGFDVPLPLPSPPPSSVDSVAIMPQAMEAKSSKVSGPALVTKRELRETNDAMYYSMWLVDDANIRQILATCTFTCSATLYGSAQVSYDELWTISKAPQKSFHLP
uniref:Uncharacterized protein n=1 Tax=Ananas comosus var. bracteatus TaxID=296719 RepID=A0A6V7QSM8_ANACO